MDITYYGHSFQIATSLRASGRDLIVFLPGLGCVKESFAQAWTTKALDAYSLLSIDFPGHGDSSKPQDFSYTIEDHAEIISVVLNEMKQPAIHLVGHSFGGAVGLLLAEKLGSRLQTFMNVEGNLISEDCGILSRKTISVSYEEFRDVLFSQLQNMMSTSPDTGSHLWAQWSRKTDPYAFYKTAQSLVRWSDSGKLLDIFLSLLVKKAYIYGEKDTPDLSKLLQQLQPISSYPIPHAGHFLMSDNPAGFYQRISDVLR